MVLFLPLTFLTLAGYFLFFGYAFGLPLAVTPLISISLISCIIYVLGLFGNLALGANLMYYSGFVFLLAFVILNAKSKKFKLKDIFAPEFALFFILALFLFIKLSSYSFSYWDEFSHWGLTIKELFVNDVFTERKLGLGIKDYPPGAAILPYFVLQIFGSFKEGIVLFTHNLFLAASLVIFLHKAKWHNWYRIIFTVISAFFIIYGFGFTIDAIYVDSMLALVTGSLLAGYFFSRNYRFMLLAIIPVLFFIPLIKNAGILFALFAASVIITDQIFFKKYSKISALKKILIVLVFLFMPFLSKATWGYYVKANNLYVEQNGSYVDSEKNYDFKSITKSFSKSGTQTDKLTMKNFSKAMLGIIGDKFNYRKASWFFISIILCIGFIAGKLETDSTRKKILTANTVSVFCFMAYSLSLLFVYLYFFPGYSGTHLYSFDRYIKTFMLSWMLVNLGFLVKAENLIPFLNSFCKKFYLSLTLGNRKLKLSGQVIAKITAIVLVMLAINRIGLAKYFLFHRPKITNTRADVVKLIDSVKKYVPPDKNCYMIWQKSCGEELYMARYELYPRISNLWYWSLGELYSANDLWTNNWTVDYFAKRLSKFGYLEKCCENPAQSDFQYKNGFDYLVIGRGDDQFWNKYYPLFENGKKDRGGIVFKIEHKNTGVILKRII